MKLTATIPLTSQSGESYPGDAVVERDGDTIKIEVGGGRYRANGYDFEMKYEDFAKIAKLFAD